MLFRSTKVWTFEIAYIAGIALVGFLFDLIIKSKKTRMLVCVYTEEAEEEKPKRRRRKKRETETVEDDNDLPFTMSEEG